MDLCVALDLPTRKENVALVQRLSHIDNLWYKIGLRSFIRDGRNAIREIKIANEKNKIFLDLKLFDTPDTMIKAVEEIVGIADIFTLHASSGIKAMRGVSNYLISIPYAARPNPIAVTVLTSFSDKSCQAVYGKNTKNKALEFALEAYDCGMAGVVCSVWEAQDINKSISHKSNFPFKIICPGIRQGLGSIDDHDRSADIADASINGVDMVVVGRPIYNQVYPERVVEEYLEIMGTKWNV